MPSVGNVVVACADSARARALGILLDMAGYSVTWVSSMAEIDAATIERGNVCVLLEATGMTSEEVEAALHLVQGRVHTIVIAEAVDVSRGARSLRSGAFDVFDAAFSPSDLLNSLHEAMFGAAEREPIAVSAFSELTPREQQVLSPLVHGYSAKAIGETLGISPRTVEVHRARIMEKLAARNLPDLVRIVVERSPRGRGGETGWR